MRFRSSFWRSSVHSLFSDTLYTNRRAATAMRMEPAPSSSHRSDTLIGADFLRPQQFRRFVEMACGQGDLLHVRRLRIQCEISHPHVLGHSLPKWNVLHSGPSMLSHRRSQSTGRPNNQFAQPGLSERSCYRIVRSGLVQCPYVPYGVGKSH